MAKRSRVEEFLSTAKPARPGGKCRTCQHPSCKDIDADAIEFNQKRGDGSTTVSWPFFVANHIATEYDYTHNFRSLLAHLEKCRGQEVK